MNICDYIQTNLYIYTYIQCLYTNLRKVQIPISLICMVHQIMFCLKQEKKEKLKKQEKQLNAKCLM